MKRKEEYKYIFVVENYWDMSIVVFSSERCLELKMLRDELIKQECKPSKIRKEVLK